MFRVLLLATIALMGCAADVHSQTEQQTLVDRSTLVVQELLGEQNGAEARNLLKKAKGVMVCPQIFKAGFFVGGQGGGCVLVGRGNGTWSGPAFYTMSSGSLGLQIGVQDAQMIFIVLTDKGLQALLDSQFKFGGDASVAVASIGAGVSGSTTAALRADIVSFATARGLFAGISVEGSLLSTRSEWNTTYYGKTLGAQQIVIGMEGQNPGAEPLKETLNRFAQ